MSSPVQPPLRVETVDGTTSGRPITTIKVTNGDLSISGAVATIDTSGAGGGGTVTSVGTSQAFITITDPTTTPSISIGNASGAATGVLTAADWTTFNNKGSGTIGGSSTANQISFGDTTANEITSSGNLQFLSGQNLYVGGRIQIGNATGTKLTTVTSQDLILDTNEGTDSGNITIEAGANGQISLTPNGTGVIKLDGVELDNSAIATNYILKASSATAAGWVAESIGIGGTIAENQIAVGTSTADEIEGTAALTFSTSVMSVKNQIELSDTGAAGILKNSQSNQDLRLQVSGTGNVRIENQTTNTASQLNVKGNGTGTPQISLSNDSKAITIKCDENQKLKVAGGSSSFIFDASGANTGITWPDGTTQITAADNGYNVILPDPTLMTAGVGSSRFAKIPACTFLIGDGAGSTAGITTTTFFYPFIANHTGDLASITVEVASAASGVTHDFGIYSVSNGFPTTLIGKANIDVGTTGIKTQTTLSATISLTKGEMYWLGWSRATGTGNSTLQCVEDLASTGASFGLGIENVYGFSSESCGCFFLNSSGALPSSVTLADLDIDNKDFPHVGLLW